MLWGGCKDASAEQLLHGKWLIQDYQIETSKVSYFPEKLQEEIEKLKSDSYFYFDEQRYEIRLNGTTETGQWQLDYPNRRLLTIQKGTRLAIPLGLEHLSSNALTLTSKRDSVLTRIHLRKVSGE